MFGHTVLSWPGKNHVLVSGSLKQGFITTLLFRRVGIPTNAAVLF